MSKADVLALVADLGGSRCDAGVANQYYDDVAYELARASQTLEINLIPSVADTAQYAYPSDAVNLLAVFYDDKQLSRATIREMDAHSINWRDERGTPDDVVTEFEDAKTFRLAPTPDRASADFIFMGTPLGSEYPEYTCAALYQQKRDDLPAYFDLYMALEILSREFSRESDHRDLRFAQACQQLAALVLRMVT